MIENNSLQGLDSFYDTRINENCVNRLKSIPLVSTNVEEHKRPKCSISPKDQSNIVVTDNSIFNSENCLQNITNNLSIYSPYMNKTRPDTLPSKAFAQPYPTICLNDSALQNRSSLFVTSSPYYLPVKNQTDKKLQSNNLRKNIFLKNLDESKPLYATNSLCDSAFQENVNGSSFFDPSSPCYLTSKLHLSADNHFNSTQLQSTPNKNFDSLLMTAPAIKVNFHSIVDLAKSDNNALSTSVNDTNNVASANSSGFVSTNNNISCNLSNSPLNLKVKEYSSLLAISCNNKENRADFLSKVYS